MKNKIRQSLALFAIVIIEVLLFNDTWKYLFLDCVYSPLYHLAISNLKEIKVIILVVLIMVFFVLRIKLRKKKEEPLYIVFLIKGFQAKGSDLIGFLNVLFVLCSIAWIGNEFFKQNIDGYLNALILLSFLLLYPILVVSDFKPKDESEKEFKPRILISALSMIDQDKLQKSLDEMNSNELKDKWMEQSFKNPDGTTRKTGPLIWGPWGNLDPIRKSIIVHKACFNQIILIASREAMGSVNILPAHLRPNILIENFLNSHFPNQKVKIVIDSQDISGNDMKMNSVGIENLLNTLKAEKFLDKDILFNITSGTAAMSAAMILKAIPYERCAEYTNQDTGMIEEILLNIYDVKELWNELLEKID